MRRSKEETRETISKLIKVARYHFTYKGYADAALEEIVEEAGVTRGALYHHFKNKKELFQNVLEQVQAEIAECVEEEAARSEDAWEQLYLGCQAFISAAIEPQNKRILLIDGPAVLGWDSWRRMDELNSMRLMREQLLMMQDEGYLKPISIDGLTHMLSGALNETALWLAQFPEEKRAIEETMEVIQLLFIGLRAKR
ncbi:TetR/AcrR family transcriptional regulator [Paenibacillus sp. EC2-1]|uniref:TetR/AcrR family transcriptional regulator n=1 Tax=Paenibacillus sp. EC2-1 TaxID=3388665 RepID=UPI003BEEE565